MSFFERLRQFLYWIQSASEVEIWIENGIIHAYYCYEGFDDKILVSEKSFRQYIDLEDY